jgi:hypothetical protein
MEHLLFYDSLEEDFATEDEDLDNDLSGVCINLVRNIHDKSFEMTVEVFGKDNMDEAPITSDIVYDPEAYLGKSFHRTTICPRCLIRIFDSKLINLFIQKDLKINWNRDWQTQAVIDPANLHQTLELIAEEQ